MNELPEPIDRSPDRALARMLLLALMLLVFSWGLLGLLGGESQEGINPLYTITMIASTLMSRGLIVLAWFFSAFGLGLMLERWLSPSRSARGFALLVGSGSALLIVATWGVASMSRLTVISSLLLLLPGWILAVKYGWPRRLDLLRPALAPLGSWLVAIPAAALLLAAATIAPGLLWPSEYAGYDVLSYHLQLPREWLADGQVLGLTHNVYSYLPSAVEITYLHLALWSETPINAAIPAQIWHAAMTLIAAALIAELTRRLVQHVESATAHALTPLLPTLMGLAYLATPWTIITGSLAYNEQAAMVCGLAALALAMPDPDPGNTDSPDTHSPARSIRLGILIGLMIGTCLLCKLTIGLMIAPAVAMIWLMTRRERPLPHILSGLTAMVLIAMLIFSGWMLRNGLWTGNPFFPLLTEQFGNGHWPDESAARWQAAHAPDEAWGSRFSAFYEMAIYASGSSRFAGQFGYVIWPLALIGMVLGLIKKSTRLMTVMLIAVAVWQIIAWLCLTHHQSRFLIPLLIPALGLISLGLLSVPSRRSLPDACLGLLVILWLTGLSYAQFSRVTHSLYLIDGSELVAEQLPPYGVLNELGQDPTARIYAEGFAQPFYVTTPITYRTVWDVSPWGEALNKDAGAAYRWLIERGYTHVLIDWAMINLWRSPGNYGYDSRITAERIHPLIQDRLLLPLNDDLGPGRVLYKVVQPEAGTD